MIWNVYAIRDEKTKMYATPVPMLNEEYAARWFDVKIKNDLTMNFAPHDFSLWFLATWDDKSGTYICDANQMRKVKGGTIQDG